VQSVGFAGFVSNGAFESGDLTGWTWAAQPSVTHAVVDFDVYGSDGPSNAFRVNPTGAAIGPGSSGLSQWISLTAGTEYTVSWEQGFQNIGPYLLETGIIEVSLGGRLLHRTLQGVLGANSFTGHRETKSFTADITGTHELQFRFRRASRDYGASTVHMYIDNVAVFDSNPVPEPGSLIVFLALGATGTVAFQVGRCRRNGQGH